MWSLRFRPDGAFIEEITGPHMSFQWGHDGGVGSACWEVGATATPQTRAHHILDTPIHHVVRSSSCQWLWVQSTAASSLTAAACGGSTFPHPPTGFPCGLTPMQYLVTAARGWCLWKCGRDVDPCWLQVDNSGISKPLELDDHGVSPPPPRPPTAAATPCAPAVG
jgi:hypothetical protein